MMDDLQAKMRKMRERYVGRLRTESARLEQLVRSLDQSDGGAALEEIERLAHGLAGSAGTFGFDEVGTHAARLERETAAVKRTRHVSPSIREVTQELTAAVARIEENPA